MVFWWVWVVSGGFAVVSGVLEFGCCATGMGLIFVGLVRVFWLWF